MKVFFSQYFFLFFISRPAHKIWFLVMKVTDMVAFGRNFVRLYVSYFHAKFHEDLFTHFTVKT